MTEGEFQGEWTAPAPGLPAAQPEVTDWSQGAQVPPVDTDQQFPAEDWSSHLATGVSSAASTPQDPE